MWYDFRNRRIGGRKMALSEKIGNTNTMNFGKNKKSLTVSLLNLWKKKEKIENQEWC